jgi:hypothetical protein
MRALKGIGAALAGSILSVGALISAGCSNNSNQDIETRVSVLERENQELKQKVATLESKPGNYSVEEGAPKTEKPQTSQGNSNLQKDKPRNFNFWGEIETGFRNIQADRETGNEMSAIYKLDLSADLSKDNIGLHTRAVVRPPVSETARSYEVFEGLGDEFQLRELYLYFDFGNHKFSGGKVRLPLGPKNPSEDERWNEPLLEYYLERYGTYDIGVRLDSKWGGDNLTSRLALTGGNAGKMDTNSALCFSGDLGYKFDSIPLKTGIWGKYNYIDSTPIKKSDLAFGPYFVAEKGRWKLLGKAGWLEQGYMQSDLTRADLEEFNYNDDEIDKILLQIASGDVKRTIRSWYLHGSMPLSEKVDLFVQYGQAYDPKDAHEDYRERVGAGLSWEIVKNLSLSLGSTLDNSTSNTRPYLVEYDSLDYQAGFFTYWAKLCWKF